MPCPVRTGDVLTLDELRRARLTDIDELLAEETNDEDEDVECGDKSIHHRWCLLSDNTDAME